MIGVSEEAVIGGEEIRAIHWCPFISKATECLVCNTVLTALHAIVHAIVRIDLRQTPGAR